MRNSGPSDLDTFPSATGGITRLAYARAKQEGVEADSLLRKADLTHQQIEDANARISVESQIRFLELAATALRDEFLGFHLAQTFDLRLIGLLYYVLASSDTIGEALRRATRYSTIVNEGIALNFRDGKRVQIDYIGVARHADHHQIEFWMVTLVRICRQLTNRRLSTSDVSFMHRRPGNTAELEAFFGSDITFGATVDELAFPISTEQLAVTSADPYLNELLVKFCEEALAGRKTKRTSFRLSVEKAMAQLLPHGDVQAGQVARQLGMSQRTLARRLSSEGLTFGGVLQRLRSDLAKRHLTDKSLSISKIAWLLGYQDPSAFTHAFKRWTGTPPRVARQSLR